jgi:hypothetical protein
VSFNTLFLISKFVINVFYKLHQCVERLGILSHTKHRSEAQRARSQTWPQRLMFVSGQDSCHFWLGFEKKNAMTCLTNDDVLLTRITFLSKRSMSYIECHNMIFPINCTYFWERLYKFVGYNDYVACTKIIYQVKRSRSHFYHNNALSCPVNNLIIPRWIQK